MQFPSIKVITQLIVALLGTALAGLLSDTSWTTWFPSNLTWLVPIALQLIAAAAAYLKAETNPPASAFTSRK